MCITILCVPLQYQNKQTMKTVILTQEEIKLIKKSLLNQKKQKHEVEVNANILDKLEAK